MATRTLPPIIQALDQLSERLRETKDADERFDLLKEMRLLLADADQVVRETDKDC